MNRLYVVESTYTVTGTMADHRLRLPPSQIGGFLVAVARELKAATAAQNCKSLAQSPDIAAPADVPEKWVKAVAKDLAEHAGKADRRRAAAAGVGSRAGARGQRRAAATHEPP